MNPAHCLGQFGGRGVLDDESRRPGIHRPAQVPGASEGGNDENLDVSPSQAARHLDAVHSGHLDVEQQHIGTGLLNRQDDLVATTALADHLDVGFQGEQSDKGTAYQGLIIGENEFDRLVGHNTTTLVPRPLSPEPMSSCPPTPSTRRLIPARPEPSSASPTPMPSSMMHIRSSDRSIQQHLA